MPPRWSANRLTANLGIDYPPRSRSARRIVITEIVSCSLLAIPMENR
jgi:hypothetical protein